MRRAVLLIALGLAGCANVGNLPSTTTTMPSSPIQPEPAKAAPLPEPETAPMPREIRPSPHRASRLEGHRNSKDPILSDLARGHIKAGDPIEPLIRLNPHYDVLRYADRVEMHYNPTGYGGTFLIAKGGIVLLASTCSCVYHDVFIQSLPDEDWLPLQEAREAARQKRLDAWTTMPAVVGNPAAYFVARRPPLAR